MTTDTPRTDACPYCGASYNRLNIFLNPCDHIGIRHPHGNVYQCGTSVERGGDVNRSNLCLERKARQKAEAELAASKAEVERLNGLLSDLLILTEKNYWNSTNYKQIKEAHRSYK